MYIPMLNNKQPNYLVYKFKNNVLIIEIYVYIQMSKS